MIPKNCETCELRPPWRCPCLSGCDGDASRCKAYSMSRSALKAEVARLEQVAENLRIAVQTAEAEAEEADRKRLQELDELSEAETRAEEFDTEVTRLRAEVAGMRDEIARLESMCFSERAKAGKKEPLE